MKMAHFADEIVGIIAAGVAAYMASKAKQSAEKGSSVAGAIRDAVSQRLPNLFGIGRVDEQLFESIRMLVKTDERRLVDLVISTMKDYEADIFRLTVAGMSCGNELADKSVTDSKGKTTTTKELKSWEFTEKDLRVKYLTEISNEVSGASERLGEQASAALVVTNMRSRRFITRNPAAQKAYELWVDATEWVKTEVLDFFGVESFNKITPSLIAKHINVLARQVPYRRPADVNPGFWRSAFSRHPVYSGTLLLGFIALAWRFYSLASITS
ncbi:hypothetical protein HY412_01475 [Candidatus Kaiserbacteria bacterium]|nr:hypothetical protein [Candidatus Kaiserbacteria bacterium]